MSTAHDVPVLEQIRHAILDGEWQPGERLAPMTLAQRFETSTTVVREALTRLVGESLVEAEPNRGFFMPSLDLQQFLDVTELRCQTESLALRLSLERGDLRWETDLITAHHRVLRTPRRSSAGRVDGDWRIAHWAFHHALLAGCGCEPMLRVASSLAQATDLYRCWAAPAPAASKRDVEAEHKELVEAALARNVARAVSLLRTHFETSARIVAGTGSAVATRRSRAPLAADLTFRPAPASSSPAAAGRGSAGKRRAAAARVSPPDRASAK